MSIAEETNAQTAKRLATGLNQVDKAKIFALLAIADAVRSTAALQSFAARELVGGGTDAGCAR